MRLRRGFGLVVACCVACAASSVQAAVIYDNLSPAGTTADGVSAGAMGPLYNSFSTGTAGGSLTEVQVRVHGQIGMTGSNVVGLFANGSGNTPGSLLTSIGTLSVALPDAPGNMVDTLSLTTPYVLSPSTRYWIGISNSTSDGAFWLVRGDGAGIGVAGEFYSTNAYTLPASSGAAQMSVTVSNPAPAAVPEIDPAGAGSIMALLACACGLLERRRLQVA